MEPTRVWEKVKEVFDAALQHDPAERSEFLRETCAGDESLRAEVESLLSAYGHSDELSRHASSGQSCPETHRALQIGPYHLVSKIGEGGMGQVWLAEQSDPLPRQVALKLIRAGLYDHSVLRRFRAE